jgi:hypothetical protein
MKNIAAKKRREEKTETTYLIPANKSLKKSRSKLSHKSQQIKKKKEGKHPGTKANA